MEILDLEYASFHRVNRTEKSETRIHHQCPYISQTGPDHGKQCDFRVRSNSRVLREPVNGRHDHRWPIHVLIALRSLLSSQRGLFISSVNSFKAITSSRKNAKVYSSCSQRNGWENFSAGRQQQANFHPLLQTKSRSLKCSFSLLRGQI
jgi:hypothetical protein